MQLSDFDKKQINIYLKNLDKDSLDLFTKNQIFKYLNSVDKDINPKLSNKLKFLPTNKTIKSKDIYEWIDCGCASSVYLDIQEFDFGGC
ncbi:MAG: hypothetical protein ACOCZ5_00025 [bacterium]